MKSDEMDIKKFKYDYSVTILLKDYLGKWRLDCYWMVIEGLLLRDIKGACNNNENEDSNV